jgi:hypothetical protein
MCTGLQLEFPLEVCVFHILGLCLCPRFQSHLLDQAQIEDFGVMRYFGCSVCVGMEMVTWKVSTLRAEVNASLRDASVNVAGFGPAKEIWVPSLFATSFTYSLLNWDAPVLGGFGS